MLLHLAAGAPSSGFYLYGKWAKPQPSATKQAYCCQHSQSIYIYTFKAQSNLWGINRSPRDTHNKPTTHKGVTVMLKQNTHNRQVGVGGTVDVEQS